MSPGFTRYTGPASLTGEDGVRRIGALVLHRISQDGSRQDGAGQDRIGRDGVGQHAGGGWRGSFRPNGANPVGPGPAVLHVGGRALEVLVVDWRAAPSVGGNAILHGWSDWPL